MGCDFFATSGHKWLLGPKGTGLLYIRRAMLGKWRPTYVGAYSDETYDLDALALVHAVEGLIGRDLGIDEGDLPKEAAPIAARHAAQAEDL